MGRNGQNHRGFRRIAGFCLGPQALALGCLLGCSGAPAQVPSSPDAGVDREASPSHVTAGDTWEVPPAPVGCEAVDILFVIDNSPSMAPYQEALATAFPGFIDEMWNVLPA